MATVRHLSTAYPTRNTNTPECRAAAEWVAGEMRKIPGLEVELMSYHVPAGRRVPKELDVLQVVATLPGETTRRVMIGGHLDTINLGGDPMTAITPGANDDASGVAATMELARVFAGRGKPKNTMMFVAFTGEEQGLYGSTALAARAKTEGWTIDALLSNDTVGGGQGAEGQRDKGTVRVYSEEPTGEREGDHAGRELARLIEWESRGKIRGFRPRLVFRRDRFQRGGDHTPFNNAGFTAVRVVESLEDLSRQHTPRDTVEGVDPKYLTNVTRMNEVALAALSMAGAPPKNVVYDAKQSPSTILRWEGESSGAYVVYWRETSSPIWQGSLKVGNATSVTVPNVNKDDHTFAVGAIGGVPVAAERIR